METDTKPSSRACERESAASAEQGANWTADQIRSAIEAEREATFDLLTEVLVRVKKDMIPEVVATLPALRARSDRRGLSAGCRSPRSGYAKRFTTKVK